MTEVPDDVMKAAVKAYETPIVEDGSSLVSLVNKMVEDEVKLCIARAILAERERCAKVADRYAANNKGGGGQAFAAFTVATEIGRSIRKQQLTCKPHRAITGHRNGNDATTSPPNEAPTGRNGRAGTTRMRTRRWHG